MSWKEYRQAGGSSGFKARGTFADAQVSVAKFKDGEYAPSGAPASQSSSFLRPVIPPIGTPPPKTMTVVSGSIGKQAYAALVPPGGTTVLNAQATPTMSKEEASEIATSIYTQVRGAPVKTEQPAPLVIPREEPFKFSYPFLSRAGQRERLENVNQVMDIAGRKFVNFLTFGLSPPGFDTDSIQANVQNTMGKKVLEYVANRPAETALSLTGLYGIGKVAATRITTGVVQKTTASVAKESLAQKLIWKGLARGSAVTTAVGFGLQGIAESGLPPEQRKALQTQAFHILASAEASERAAEAQIGGQAWYKQFAYQIPPINAFMTGKLYENSLRDQLRARGYTGTELETMVKAGAAERKGRVIGEVGGFFAVSANVERVGRSSFATVYARKELAGEVIKKNFLQRATEGTRVIAPLGWIEGSIQEREQQAARLQPVNLKEINLMGLFGLASAGVAGGAIYGLSAIGKKGGSVAVETIANLGDLYEKPADLFATGTEKVEKVVFKSNIAQASIFQKGNKAFYTVSIPTITPVPTSTKTTFLETTGQVKKPGSRFKILDFIYGGQTPTQTPTQTNTNVPTPADIVGSITPTNIPEPVPVTEWTFIPIPTVIDTPTDTETTTPTDTETQTETTTPTPTITFGVPIVTPIFRMPPPIPLFDKLAMPTGLGFGKRRKGSFFFNEVEAAGGILAQGLGGKALWNWQEENKLAKKTKKYIKKEREKMAKRNKRAASSGGNIPFLNALNKNVKRWKI